MSAARSLPALEHFAGPGAQRLRVAYHEAAHFVVATVRDMRPGYLEIRDGGRRGGEMGRATGRFPTTDVVAVYLAGFQGERVFRTTRLEDAAACAADDYRIARRMVAEVVGERQAFEHVDLIDAETRAQVEHEADAIHALAGALYRRQSGILMGDLARHIIRPHLRSLYLRN